MAIMLKQGAVDSINNQLEDIDINVTQKITLHDLDDRVDLSPIYISVCAGLLDMLTALDNRAQQISVDRSVTVSLIYMAMKDLRPDFEETASILKYRMINFLCNHLQVKTTSTTDCQHWT